MKKVFCAIAVAMLTLPAVARAADAPDAATQAVPAKPAVAAEAAPKPAVVPEPEKKSTAAPAKFRIGYVDLVRIGSESDMGKAAKEMGKQKQEKFQSKIDARRKQLDKQKTALEAKFASLSPAQREAKAKEFQKKVEEFQKFGMNAEKELQTFQEEQTTDVFKAVERAAVEYGLVNGLSLVMIKRELLYLANGIDAEDVTAGIIKLMNEKSAKK